LIKEVPLDDEEETVIKEDKVSLVWREDSKVFFSI